MRPHNTLSIFPASDLHLNLNTYQPSPASLLADVIVLSGDILSSPADMMKLRVMWPEQRIIYVPGAAEYRFKDINLALGEYSSAAIEYGIDLLNHRSVEIGGVVFIGATLWSDFAINGDLERATEAAAFDLDFTSIKRGELYLTPYDAIEMHKSALEFIRAELLQETYGPKVVVTHQAPSKISLQALPEYFHPCAGSNLEEIAAQADFWFHGWLHGNVDYSIGGCRVVCNSRGHVADVGDGKVSRENNDFNESLIIFPGENQITSLDQDNNADSARPSMMTKLRSFLGGINRQARK